MYMNETNLLYEALENGAEKARAIAKVNLAEIKSRLDLRGTLSVPLFYKKSNEISICYQYRVRRDKMVTILQLKILLVQIGTEIVPPSNLKEKF